MLPKLLNKNRTSPGRQGFQCTPEERTVRLSAVWGRTGFTLIESLVVIGVIVLLTGLLFPVFSQARSRAKVQASLSNLRQLYVGMSLYRENSGIATDYGSAEQMGLPVNVMTPPNHRLVVADDAVWKSPCCCHQDFPTSDYGK